MNEQEIIELNKKLTILVQESNDTPGVYSDEYVFVTSYSTMDIDFVNCAIYENDVDNMDVYRWKSAGPTLLCYRTGAWERYIDQLYKKCLIKIAAREQDEQQRELVKFLPIEDKFNQIFTDVLDKQDE
jgi:hypothetical protein